MKKKFFALVLVACFMVSSAYAAQDKSKDSDKKSKAQTSDKRDGEGRKKYLQQKEGQIDKEYERKIDKARDGQKGMSNSGATQKKIDQLEKERDARKKNLRDHYNKGPKAKGD